MPIKAPTQTYPQSIEQLFNLYLEGAYVINRKYQRKLVWTLAKE
jgi:uncharacterized protein with ParB-like and HNH nuclease domain